MHGGPGERTWRHYSKPGAIHEVTGSDPYGLDADNNGRGCE